jgi:hypothetical protein
MSRISVPKAGLVCARKGCEEEANGIVFAQPCGTYHKYHNWLCCFTFTLNSRGLALSSQTLILSSGGS